MNNLRTILTTVVLAFLLTTSFLMTLVMVPETVSAYTVRDPIHIDGNAEFTAANGVTGGSGTASDPYIIEGWDIDASSAHGIWIQDTNAYFTIRNCYIHDSGGDLFGIYLLRCVNGTVTGNTCSNNDDDGINLTSSSDNTLSDNNCSYNDCGIGLYSSSNDNTLSDNNCSNNYDGGIRLDSSSDNTLSNNTCSNNGLGICLYSSSNSILSDNNCSYNYDGIRLYSSSNNTLSDNNCSSNNDCGIYLSWSSNDNTLSNNTCSNNGLGIYLDSSSDNTLSDNNCSNNENGIRLYSSSNNNTLSGNSCSSNNQCGIALVSSSDNVLSNNNCSNNENGIKLDSSSNNNTLVGNNCSSNIQLGIECGIALVSSSDNVLSDNNCANNVYGINLDSSSDNALSSNNCSSNLYVGIDLDSLCNNNTLIGNNCSDSNSGIRLFLSSDNTLINNNCSDSDSGIRLFLSSDNTLINNNCSNNENGIRLDSSSDNTLINNNCSNNENGIILYSSSNNTLRDNTASSNGYGVFLWDSTGTTVYRNIFFDHTDNNAYDDRGSENSWNASYPIGGNYWDDYTGVDEFSGPDQDQPGPDGIGDTPYIIDADSFDHYPLMMEPLNTPPTASFTVSPSTGYVNTVFSVDASSSSDAEDDLSMLEVRWDWESDGVWDTSWSVVKTHTHLYSAEGTHTITLEARDTKGFADNTTRQVAVVLDDVPPVADAGPNQTVTVGDMVTFDGSDSSDDVGIVNYIWTFTYDDEERELLGVGPTFTFDIAGTYIVTLTVEDAGGGTDEDTVTIIVEEEEEQEDDEKGFIETYGLPLGIVVALAIIALILFLALKGRKGGKAPTSIEEPPATEPVD